MKTTFMLYVPVLHQGYLNLFDRVDGQTNSIFIFGPDILKKFNYLDKEIRAINPLIMVRLIKTLNIFNNVGILTPILALSLKKHRIITVDEEISHRVVGKYFPESKVMYENWFLRWDEKSVYSQSIPTCKISRDEADRAIMKEAGKTALESPDWWRQVGAIIKLKSGDSYGDFNHHLPDSLTPYINGDPRDFIPAGERSDLTSAIHTEQKIIAFAAKKGIRLEGSSLYVTCFPCPVCAKLIGQSGIKNCYFLKGHASLDGLKVLMVAGVEVIQVC